MNLIYQNVCYVVHRIFNAHPITDYRHDLIWYPEDAMTLFDSILYRPYTKSIVTENPWLISMYDREHVRLWSTRDKVKGEWILPRHQTYGASVNMIMMNILGVTQTIPSMAKDGGESIQKVIKKVFEGKLYN